MHDQQVHAGRDTSGAGVSGPGPGDPREQARAAIAEATLALNDRRATPAEHATAYRRRADAWTQLAQTVPYDPQLTPAMLHAAADDISRARTLSRTRARPSASASSAPETDSA